MSTNKELPVKLSRPAQRALANERINTLKQVAAYSKAEIAALHGVGATAILALAKALKEKGMSFLANKKKENN